MQVFLSYSRKDGAFVGRLAADLERRGIDVWLDTDDLATADEDRWRRSIVRSIRESVALVVVLSPDSVRSGPVERELTIAAETMRRIIPIVHRPCELPDGFQFELAGVQRIDFADQPYEPAFDQLVSRIGPPIAAAAPALPRPSSPPVLAAPVGPEPLRPVPPAKGRPTAVRRRTWALVVAGVAVAALGTGGVIALGGDPGDGGDGLSAGTTDRTVTEPSVTEPSVAETQAGVDIREPTPPAGGDVSTAIALVDELAQAYNNRDWDAVRRLNVNQAHLGDEELVAGYGTPDGLPRLERQFYWVLSNDQTGTSDWRIVGAILAWDYGADGSQTTNVACIEWGVDTAARTAAQTSFDGTDGRPNRRLDGWLPVHGFHATATEYCR